MSNEEKELRIESLARELPRRGPSVGTIMNVSEAIHGEARPVRRTEFGPVMDMEELAEFLRVDAETVEEYLDQIPCFELGGKLLFRLHLSARHNIFIAFVSVRFSPDHAPVAVVLPFLNIRRHHSQPVELNKNMDKHLP